MQKVPLAVSPDFTWQLPMHEQADQALPEGPGLWELLAWKVGRGVEDILEWEDGKGGDLGGEGRCVVAEGRSSIPIGCGVGHTSHLLLLGGEPLVWGLGFQKDPWMVWFHAVGISSRGCLGYWGACGI